jgi:Zn-dependent protease with chaperone function
LHEPFESGEVVSDKLGVIALVSSFAVLIAVYRIVHTFLVTRGLIREWLRGATRITLDRVDVPVFRIEHEFPIIAVTGILRPKLFIAEKVMSALTDDELSAAIAHEYGHMAARDNFKRTMLRLCRDLIIVPVGKSLDRDWADTSEAAADEYAARHGAEHALDLASALVKITRMVPAYRTASMPVATFLLGTDAGDVTARVRNLLRLSEQLRRPDKSGFISPPGLLWIGGLLFVLCLPLLDSSLHLSTHHGIEAFVQFLQ